MSHTISATCQWGAEAAVQNPQTFIIMALIAAVTCTMLAIEQVRERDTAEAVAFATFAITAAIAAVLAYGGRTDQLASWFVTAAWVSILALCAWLAWAAPQAFAGAKDGRQDRRIAS